MVRSHPGAMRTLWEVTDVDCAQNASLAQVRRADVPVTDEPRGSSGHRKPFGMVDPDVLRDPTLGWATKLVYTLLTTYCAKTRDAYPSRSRIAAELGISVRSVDAGLREARERGLIEVERRANSGGDW